ncbi:hypothetical protein niasHS_018193 [Heterodera schachtii]|uniref:MnmG N-terminal domain-containing protein n=1 Tax=Heterodera schachtii TaxID=97005 RepID=A0ABD2I8I0_HETSC
MFFNKQQQIGKAQLQSGEGKKRSGYGKKNERSRIADSKIRTNFRSTSTKQHRQQVRKLKAMRTSVTFLTRFFYPKLKSTTITTAKVSSSSTWITNVGENGTTLNNSSSSPPSSKAIFVVVQPPSNDLQPAPLIVPYQPPPIGAVITDQQQQQFCPTNIYQTNCSQPGRLKLLSNHKQLLCEQPFKSALKYRVASHEAGHAAACARNKDCTKVIMIKGDHRTKCSHIADHASTRFTIQPSDAVPIPFSFLNRSIGIPHEKLLLSYVGYTDERLVKMVCENVDENHSLISALNEGIKGPRYCPSLEAKCLRFGHLKHRVRMWSALMAFWIRQRIGFYPQGCALGFTIDVQQKIMRSIDGLERVEVVQPGYSVRYDFVHPQQLWPSLETRKVVGLFLAGQINGTTGYEEAAAQGLMAGLNASIRARHRQGKSAEFCPLILERTNAYIGVMIDDLISLGVTEPYRMYTSHAENRLFMR